MRTVRDACQLHENALRIKLSDQVEQLKAVRMELISHNPAQHVIYPTKGQTEK